MAQLPNPSAERRLRKVVSAKYLSLRKPVEGRITSLQAQDGGKTTPERRALVGPTAAPGAPAKTPRLWPRPAPAESTAAPACSPAPASPRSRRGNRPHAPAAAGDSTTYRRCRC